MNLFICFTPLQVLIAKKVIKYMQIKQYSFIYFSDIESTKNMYYFQVLKEQSDISIKILRTKNIYNDFINIYKAYKKLKKFQKFENFDIYSGNIKAVHTRFLMFLLGYKDLYTFDDGCGNIVNHGYYANDNEHKLYKLFFLFMKPSLIYKNLRKTMKIHFSIYKESNIYPNVQFINLFNYKKMTNQIKLPSKVVLLTSALSEFNIMNIDMERKMYANIIKHFHVSSIIIHHREEILKVSDNVTVIETDQIAEENIFELSKKYEVTVIGIFSAALLNMSGLKVADKLLSIDFENSHINNDLIQIFKKRDIECYKFNNEGKMIEL